MAEILIKTVKRIPQPKNQKIYVQSEHIKHLAYLLFGSLFLRGFTIIQAFGHVTNPVGTIAIIILTHKNVMNRIPKIQTVRS